MGEEETRMAFRGGVAVGLAALRAGRRLQSDRCVGCGLGVRPSLPAPATPRAAARAAFSGRAQGRPFRVLGLQQVAVGAESKDDMRRIWQDMLGLEKQGEFRSEKENVDEDILTLGRGLATVEVDIMAPLDVTKSPKVHVPNLNHIGLWVDKLEESSHGSRAAGYASQEKFGWALPATRLPSYIPRAMPKAQLAVRASSSSSCRFRVTSACSREF